MHRYRWKPIKPYHEGINPFNEYRNQISDYILAHGMKYGPNEPVVVRFILYSFV